MNENEIFYKEASEWIQSLGYYEHIGSSDKSSVVFQSQILDGYYPTITCFINELGEKRCNLMDTQNFKMFLTLNSGDVSFKHPKILKYINVFRYYSMLAEQNPPSL